MMAAALRVPAARPSSGSVGGVGTVPGQGHSRRQSGGGGGVRTCLSTRPGWASGSPWSPVSPRGPPSKEGFVHCYGPVGGSRAGPGAGRPVGSQRGVRMGAVTAELTGARPPVAGVQSAGDGASRAAGSREPGARGSSGRAAPHGGRCTVGASLVSDSWSRQRDTRFPSVGGPQPPALSWPLCLSRPPWPSPPPFPATSHTRASGFHTGRLGRPCRARAGPARGPAGPRLSGLHAPQNPCSPEGPARRDCPQGTPRDVWGRLWLSHWGRIWHGVGGAGGAAQPPQCPGRPQRTRLPL